uniref:Uncharacterized protein n=1 Tax=Bracon brevicornis TaxID=1563983 RepID=A0A6V7JAS8_9HYME
MHRIRHCILIHTESNGGWGKGVEVWLTGQRTAVTRYTRGGSLRCSLIYTQRMDFGTLGKAIEIVGEVARGGSYPEFNQTLDLNVELPLFDTLY